MISSPDDQWAGRFGGMASDRLGYLLKHVLAGLTEAQTKALAPHGLNGRDHGTVTTNEHLCRAHILPALGARKLRDLSADDVDRWLAE